MDVCGAPPTARTAFRLRMLPLDDTRTLKYNTYATYPRTLMAARPLADIRDAALFPNYFGQTCSSLFNLAGINKQEDEQQHR